MKFLIILFFLLSVSLSTFAQTSANKNAPISSEAHYNYGVRWENTSQQLKKFELTIQEYPHEFVPQIPSPLWTFQASHKPPIFRVKQGDQLQIQIKNHLAESTSIHWHGLRVPNRMDGVPLVTQPLIDSGASFMYEFVANDVGTFWFHPHENSSEQLGRGLYAVLIVEEKTPPAYDQDWVIALKDYRLEGKGRLEGGFGNLHDATHGGRYGNFVTINNVPNPQYTVALGDRVRMRLINVSNARPYKLDFTNWNATVIAHDGGYVEQPYSVQTLTIVPGERFELDLRFDDTTKHPLPLTMKTNRSQYEIAQITYSDQKHKPSQISLPAPSLPNWKHLNNATPHHTITLGGINVMGGSTRQAGSPPLWTINGGAYPNTHQPLQFTQGQLVKIRINNESLQPHPMHLHGDFFQVLSVDGQAPKTKSWKDTLNIPGKSFAEIAMIPTNPGAWAFHCHVLEHAEIGMMTTISVN